MKYTAQSERLWLQLLSVEEHLDDYHEIISNPKGMKWSVSGLSTSLAQSKEKMFSRVKSPQNPRMENYAILLRSSVTGQEIDKERGEAEGEEGQKKAKLIGVIGAIRESEKGAEVGYGIGPEWWGKGYMTEALGLFIKTWFSIKREHDWDTLVACIDSENMPSIRVVQKAGFREGEIWDGPYELFAEKGMGKKRYLTQWYLKRPEEFEGPLHE
ncbi:hypothetical protein B7494_g3512 [Chlorociboria aeruginascens]|nr:hypothetical protein B7494_g3512 [Chlorociboria aeruginascens]